MCSVFVGGILRDDIVAPKLPCPHCKLIYDYVRGVIKHFMAF